MVTPPSGGQDISGNCARRADTQKRKASGELEVRQSASPVLKERGFHVNKRQRTPQPTLTQSKITGFGIAPKSVAIATQKTSAEEPAPPGAAVPSSSGGRATGTAAACAPTVEAMDVAPPAMSVAQSHTTQHRGDLVTTDFLLKALRENTDHISKLFTTNLGVLASKVEDNSGRIAENEMATRKNTSTLEDHNTELGRLSSRIRALERDGPQPVAARIRRAKLTDEYTFARRSVRLWPVCGEDLWGEVGEFLHGTLKIPVRDLYQEDIESISRVTPKGPSDMVNDEVLVTFYDKSKRDTVFTHATNLSVCVNGEGKPTAGIRLEIPSELEDTFRLLTRFGTRLRARHGVGTKRHVKFDDFEGSLYCSVKLPGDQSWTKVTPAMAQEDLETSIREESSRHQKRLASKLIPGPRERLNRPLPIVSVEAGPSGIRVVPPAVQGQRPRWAAPDRGPSTSRGV